MNYTERMIEDAHKQFGKAMNRIDAKNILAAKYANNPNVTIQEGVISGFLDVVYAQEYFPNAGEFDNQYEDIDTIIVY